GPGAARAPGAPRHARRRRTRDRTRGDIAKNPVFYACFATPRVARATCDACAARVSATRATGRVRAPRRRGRLVHPGCALAAPQHPRKGKVRKLRAPPPQRKPAARGGRSDACRGARGTSVVFLEQLGVRVGIEHLVELLGIL